MRSQSGSWCSPVLTNLCWNSSTQCACCESSSSERERGIPPAHPDTALEKGTGLISASHHSLLQRGTSLLCLLPPAEIPILTPSLPPWGLRSKLCSFVRAFVVFCLMQPQCMRSEVGTRLQAETFLCC